jgi:hypothetical protein
LKLSGTRGGRLAPLLNPFDFKGPCYTVALWTRTQQQRIAIFRTWNKEIFIEQVPEITWLDTQRMRDGLVEAAGAGSSRSNFNDLPHTKKACRIEHRKPLFQFNKQYDQILLSPPSRLGNLGCGGLLMPSSCKAFSWAIRRLCGPSLRIEVIWNQWGEVNTSI